MLLSPAEFDSRLESGKLVITFIGMSAIGKSYRGQQFSFIGFRHINCDNVIASRIPGLLQSEDVAGLGTWMGQPYTPLYKEREAQYLQLEEDSVSHALHSIKGNTIIDATGSVVYLSPDIQKQLKDRSLVIHLEAGETAREKLFKQYMTEPKPVVWGDSFNRNKGESDLEALSRCYPELLRYRLKKYISLADVTLPYKVARDEKSDAHEFLDAIKKGLAH
ncbi:MAG: hypothetical protein G01um10148_437 [Parcubacteria group bacterium Gr01-1014_8]|nr:MAG: hypothetical protein G01um10148_437 [Parcubacteria group bacterium Gr01-1014_8]